MILQTKNRLALFTVQAAFFVLGRFSALWRILFSNMVREENTLYGLIWGCTGLLSDFSNKLCERVIVRLLCREHLRELFHDRLIVFVSYFFKKL